MIASAIVRCDVCRYEEINTLVQGGELPAILAARKWACTYDDAGAAIHVCPKCQTKNGAVWPTVQDVEKWAHGITVAFDGQDVSIVAPLAGAKLPKEQAVALAAMIVLAADPAAGRFSTILARLKSQR